MAQILIVEDEDNIRAMFVLALREAGFDVVEAETADSATWKFESEFPEMLRAGRFRLNSVTLPISGSPAGCCHGLPLWALRREGVARLEWCPQRRRYSCCQRRRQGIEIGLIGGATIEARVRPLEVVEP
jgi:hypothetical protein